MNITLASIFANSTPYLRRYFAQAVALADALDKRGDRLTCLWGEGDSSDGTRAMLEAMRWRLNSQVVDVSHGGEIFGSVERAERFRQLGAVGRKLWAALPGDADVVLYVESDLIWGVETALGLIGRVGRDVPILRQQPVIMSDANAGTPAEPESFDVAQSVAAVAPPILLKRAGWFAGAWYDTAFFVKDGRHFAHRPPYHPANDGRSMVEMERVGSMIAMDAGLLRQAAAGYDERVLGGLCDDLRALGGGVFFAADLPAVIHE